MSLPHEADRSFYVTDQLCHVKDFIDVKYPCSTYFSDQTSIATNAYSALIEFLKAHPYNPPPVPDPNPHLYQTTPARLVVPRWLQNAYVESQRSDWPLFKTLLRDFRPCIDAAGELFRQFRPDDYDQMMRYNDDIIRSNAVSESPGVRPPV
ncbi:hypothetical protein ACEPPN_013992 [Leptodophora sp. 'Broadleaf-Isolate-01']